MLRKRRIRPREVLDEIRSGISETKLRAKYRLSSKGIERLFNLLVTNGTVDQSELFEKYPWYKLKVTHVEQRWEPRVSLKGQVYIYDVLRSSTGTLRDISEKGFRAAGIECNVGESKSLLLDFQPLIKADPVLVVAACRWKQHRGQTKKYITAGFEILDISERDSEVLRSLIESLRARPEKTDRNPARVTCQELRSQCKQGAEEVTPRRIVKAREIAKDIQSGIDAELLMRKYELTRRQLDRILRKLEDADIITEMQLYERTTLSHSLPTKAFEDKEGTSADGTDAPGSPSLNQH
jgi:uncharacterized protein (DUF433 family)